MTRAVVIIGIGLVYYGIMLLYIEIVKAPSQPHSVLHQGFNGKCAAIIWEGVVIIFKLGAIPVFFVLSYQVLTTNIDDELEGLAASYSNSSDERLRALLEVIEALDDAAVRFNLLSVVGALTILQMGFFAIRQLRFHPRLNVFARTVAASFRQFRDFVVIFFVIFMTFAFAGNSLFGKFVLEFSTASNSVVSCANMLFQTFDYGSIEAFRGSGLFYWTFMVIVNITLLNMMLAIVMRVYETITQDEYDGEISQRLMTRIRDNYPYRDALKSLLFWRSDKRKRPFPTKHDPARSKPSDTDTEAMQYFKKLKENIPISSLRILKVKRKFVHRFPNDQAPVVKITATTLTELFPAAKISEEEVDATFAYLREGFFLHEVVSENASNSTLPKGIDEAKSADKLSEELAELHARVAGIERKLDNLLEVMVSYRQTPSQ